MTPNPVVVGVDLGGTLIRAAVATVPGAHGTPARHPTPASEGPQAVIRAIAAAVREAAGDAPVGGVAIGVPGPLNPRTGIVYETPNLAGWANLPVAELLARELGCPVVIQNDAKLAGFAEWTVGVGRGTRDFLFITVSTGVGGAFILEGELYGGAAGTAGEVGHVPVSPDGPACGVGHAGCLEGVASGTAIAHRAATAIAAGEASSLRDVEVVDAVAVEHAANAGDALAMRLFDEAGRALGRAIGGFVNILSPEAIAIGGGLSLAGDLLWVPLRKALPEIAFAVPLAQCRIVPAALGTDAGLIGATAWALRRFGDTVAAPSA